MTVGINIYFSLFLWYVQICRLPRWVSEWLNHLHSPSNHCSAVFIWVMVFQTIQPRNTNLGCAFQLPGSRKFQASLNSRAADPRIRRYQMLHILELLRPEDVVPVCCRQPPSPEKDDTDLSTKGQTQTAPAICSWTWSRSASATSTQILFLCLLDDLVVMSSCLF